MSLRAIVSALGGDLYQSGRRANVPAPGHGARDRSVSLMMSGGRVVIHSFGAAAWREVRDDLQRRGLVDRDGLVPDCGGTPPTVRLDSSTRLATARALWADGSPPARHGVVARYLFSRGLIWSNAWADLLEHPQAPVSVYRPSGRTGRAMMAAVRDPAGALTAVELTYLSANGHTASGLTVPRKAVGQVPAGSAVRLCSVASRMVVAEGVVTTLSAMVRFNLPGWALMSAGNLARWRPPPGVAHVLIAGDRGVAGEAAARRLKSVLMGEGVDAAIAFPPAPWGDWNEAGQVQGGEAKEGRGGAPERRG